MSEVASQKPAPIRRFRITPTGRLKEDPLGGGLALYSDCEARIAHLEAALRGVAASDDVWEMLEIARAALSTPLGTPGSTE